MTFGAVRQNVLPGNFTPASLFVGGSTSGYWFDISDTTTLFTASTGTGLVSADGDAVGYIRDKSGITTPNNAVRNVDDTQRALFKTTAGISHLLFDGVNDKYTITTATSVTNAKTQLTTCYACRMDSTATVGTLYNFSISTNTNARASSERATTTTLRLRGRRLDADAGANTDYTSFVNNVDCVVTMEYDWANSNGNIWVNQTNVTTNTAWLTDGTTSATNSNVAMIGDVGTTVGEPYKGRLYQLVAINRALTTTERRSLITYLGAKAGLIL